jgi:hypothetical protein
MIRGMVLTDCRRDGLLRREGQVGQGLLLGRAGGLDAIADTNLCEGDRQQRPDFEGFANQSAVMRRELLPRSVAATFRSPAPFQITNTVKHGNTFRGSRRKNIAWSSFHAQVRKQQIKVIALGTQTYSAREMLGR